MLDGCWILVDRRTSGPDEGRAVVGRLFVGGRMLGGRRSSEPDECRTVVGPTGFWAGRISDGCLTNFGVGRAGDQSAHRGYWPTDVVG